MRCDRCGEEPPDTWREGLAVCDSCARKLDARAEVQALWTVTVRRERTYAGAARARNA